MSIFSNLSVFLPLLKPKFSKNGERCVNGKTVDVHFSRLLYDMIRIILFIDIDCDKIRAVGHLRNGVDYKTVVAFSVIRGHDVKSVTYAEKAPSDRFFLRGLPTVRYNRGKVLRQDGQARHGCPR